MSFENQFPTLSPAYENQQEEKVLFRFFSLVIGAALCLATFAIWIFGGAAGDGFLPKMALSSAMLISGLCLIILSKKAPDQDA